MVLDASRWSENPGPHAWQTAEWNRAGSMGFRGAVSDVDGVLVDSPHERTWRDALRQLMDTDWRGIRDRTTYSPERFTPKVYQEVMADKPRLGGADVFQGARRRESRRGLWRAQAAAGGRADRGR